MKTCIKTLLILFFCVITSCAALRAPDMSKISIGMDKQAVITALGKKPDNVIGAKKYPGGVVEVLRYITSVSSDGRVTSSWLYFYNDKLAQFGRADGDWQYTADEIAAMEGK